MSITGACFSPSAKVLVTSSVDSEGISIFVIFRFFKTFENKKMKKFTFKLPYYIKWKVAMNDI